MVFAKDIIKAHEQAIMDARYKIAEGLKDEIEDYYNPTYHLIHERSVNAIDNDRKNQNMFLELEYIIENVVAKER